MIRKRVITCLTLNEGVLFRTKGFVPDYRYTQNFVDSWLVDEIILLDITRTGKLSRKSFLTAVEKFASRCFVPLTVGGGVRQLSDCEELLAAGADKVTVNTGAIEDPSLITKIAERYGSQCVVLSIDAKEETEGSYRVYKSFGATRTDLEASDWAREGARRGAGEILITSIDRDGTLEGYDNRLNKLVVDSVQLPVIACGGAGKWAHFASAFLEANVSAVATTCVFHFTEASLSSAKKFLHSGGTLVRTS